MRIDDRLRRAAQDVDHHVGAVPMRPADEVSRRSNTQRILAYTMVGALAVAFIAGSALLLTGGSGAVDLPESAATPPTAPIATGEVDAATATVVASDVDWSVVDATVVDFNDAFAWEGTLYAVSTAPGKVDPDVSSRPGYRPAQAVYTSSDGINWDHSVVPDDLWLSDVAGYEGTLYAISTTPGSAGADNSFAATVATTGDGGRTWDRIELPVAAAAPEEMGDVRSALVGAKVAAGEGGVVVAIHSRFRMDFSPFVPDEFSAEDMYVYADDEGVVVDDMSIYETLEIECANAWSRVEEGGGDESALDPESLPPECARMDEPGIATVFTATWEQLGVTPPQAAFAEIFVSNDGVEFEAITSPFAGGELVDIAAIADGYFAVERNSVRGGTGNGWVAWSSPDGRQWSRVDLPAGLTWVRAVGAVGDEMAFLGYRRGDDPAVFHRNAADTDWVATSVAELVGKTDREQVEVGGVHFGSGGLALSVATASAGDGRGLMSQVLETSDFETWTHSPIEIAGEAFANYVGSLVAGANRTLVSAATGGPGPGIWVSLVGTER